MDSLDAKSEPDMVRACIESLSKFNSSTKGSDIFEKEESEEERNAKNKMDLAKELLKK